MNVYLYVHNNPINFVDPLGLEALGPQPIPAGPMQLFLLPAHTAATASVSPQQRAALVNYAAETGPTKAKLALAANVTLITAPTVVMGGGTAVAAGSARLAATAEVFREVGTIQAMRTLFGPTIMGIGAAIIADMGYQAITAPTPAPVNPSVQASPEPTKPPVIEPYNRRLHYGRTPTAADRKALGAGEDEVVDHNPPLVQRYYEGDLKTGEKPGKDMTPEERSASGADRDRMQLQPKAESDKQGGKMSQYSKQKKAELQNQQKDE